MLSLLCVLQMSFVCLIDVFCVNVFCVVCVVCVLCEFILCLPKTLGICVFSVFAVIDIVQCFDKRGMDRQTETPSYRDAWPHLKVLSHHRIYSQDSSKLCRFCGQEERKSWSFNVITSTGSRHNMRFYNSSANATENIQQLHI